MSSSYDRSTQDVGNIVNLEHVNTRVADQSTAHLFYVTGMGFTRDPYIDFGMRNMWINLGRQQFHLPVGEPQVLRGVTGIVVPSLDQLRVRLERVKPQLDGTQFAYSDDEDTLAITCPWGNRLRVHAPGEFGPMTLGMPYVCFDVPPATAEGIVRFYVELLDAPATLDTSCAAPTACVQIGAEQSIRFKESDGAAAEYDGHHIAIYVSNFSQPHARLNERGLISEESNEAQYRFQWLTDPDSGKKLFEIEHEVRSLTHPMYGRFLVNRNPVQNNIDYVRGHDAFAG